MSAKIPRSALDATRFTSSLPHATSKPFPAATTATSATRTARGSGPLVRKPNGVSKLQPSPGPQGETPQEKVKRLRAAWDKARAAQETPLERIILKGRGWADRTHKVTVLSLLGFSVVMVIVTVYALVDAARYNRRKKQEYFTEKRAAYAAGLIVSRRAIEAGTANQAQKDLVAFDDEETARLERLQAEKLAAKGSWGRGIKDFLFGGLKEEEDRRALTSLVQELVHEVTPEEEKKEGSEEESPSFMASKVDEIGERAKASMTHEKSNQERGGPLDHLGAQATRHPDTKSTQSWTSWLTRR